MTTDELLARALDADRRRHERRMLLRLGRPGRWLRRRGEWRARRASAAAEGQAPPAWRDPWDRRRADR